LIRWSQDRRDGFRPSITGGAPIAAGGTNTGPTPYDLLLAALGSCTSMTVGMADHVLESISGHLSTQRSGKRQFE